MTGKLFCAIGVALFSLSQVTQAHAQENEPAQPPYYGVLGEASGTGDWPAVAEVFVEMPWHTSYHPATPTDFKLPIVIWGTGGCRDDGTGTANILREIASHGYFVMSTGRARDANGMQTSATRDLDPSQQVTPPPSVTASFSMDMDQAPPESVSYPRPGGIPASELTRALDWLLLQNEIPGSPLFDRLDHSKVAIMGFSCGGLQAMSISHDPRVTTTVMWNSGILPFSRAVGIDVTKDQLERLHAPLLYILGGETDVAYLAAIDDFEREETVPVALVSRDVGHVGGFTPSNYVAYSKPGIAWLDLQLKGLSANEAMFVGSDCGFCDRDGWSARAKNFP